MAPNESRGVNMSDKKWTEDLTCDLTEEEVAERSGLAARLMAGYEEREEELKLHAADERGNLKRIRTEMSGLLRCVRTGQEERPVEVVQHRNEAAGRVEVVRTDTGEVVRSRAFTENERQIGLFPVANEPEETQPDEQ